LRLPAAAELVAEKAQIRAFSRLARLMLNPLRPSSVTKGRIKMAKFEMLSFSVGMMLTALLTFATLAPIA
jgi:hypothetical protein